MKNFAVLIEDGAFSLFFHPHPRGFYSSRFPAPRNLLSKAKKVLKPRVQLGLGTRVGGGGGVGPSWNWLVLKAGFHWWWSWSQSRKQNPKSTYDLGKSKNWCHKHDGIGVRRIRTFPILPTLLTTPSLAFCLWSSENQIVRVGSRSERINQSQCTFPCFVIGLVLPLLLPTPTIWFLLDHKWNVSDWVVSRIRTLFSLDRKLYPSDYDSDSNSVTSENQP